MGGHVLWQGHSIVCPVNASASTSNQVGSYDGSSVSVHLQAGHERIIVLSVEGESIYVENVEMGCKSLVTTHKDQHNIT